MTDVFHALVVVVAGLFGLVVGSFLNSVVDRAPAGVPLARENRCPQCDAPVRGWQNVPIVSWLALRGRCAKCGEYIPVRYPLIEAAVGLAFAAIAWYFIERSALPLASAVVVTLAYLYFAAASIVLTLIDLDTHRLPNAIVLPSYPIAIGLFAIACLLGADWWALGRAGIGMSVLYGFYFVLRLVRPDGMGGGDVKLAGIIGLYLGWLGWATFVVGAFAAFLLGGVFGAILLATRKAGRGTAIPFGPWMLLGAWTGIFAGELVGRLYGGSLNL